MLKKIFPPAIFASTLFACNLAVTAQTPATRPAAQPGAQSFAAPATPSNDTDRDRDGLQGPVRRIRTENAKLLSKDGKSVEGPHAVLETATYDPKGGKIDTAYFPTAGGVLTGKEVYKYDDRGNIAEMTLLGDNGSVLSKESYRYEFDQLGNWTKMTTSVAVVENGKLDFEPSEVTYRVIAYYLEDATAKRLQTAAPTPSVIAAASQPTTATAKSAPVVNSPVPAKTAAALPNALATNTNPTLTAPGASAVNVATNAANSGAPVSVKDDEAPPPPKPRAPLKPISGGVLNGKALSLPVPAYPEMARRARTFGLVTVEVVIDLNGKVISAHAVGGPTMLRGAAEQAAQQARFSQTTLSGQAVRVSGTITYNFAL